jgi:hypothetical protein
MFIDTLALPFSAYHHDGNEDTEDVECHIREDDVISFCIGIFIGLIVTGIVTEKTLLTNRKDIRCSNK